MESMWVFRQLPSNGEFDAAHAGLIYGLGLIGALKSFTSADAYELLSAGNEDVTSSLLLGMALSNTGSGHDSKFLTQMIGIHVPGYLPVVEGNSPQLAQIPLSNLVSAVISLGYLFKGRADRRVTAVLFKELARRGSISLKSKLSYTPAYTLAAGLAIGLVNTGNLEGLDENQVQSLLNDVNGSNAHSIPAAFFALLAIYAGTDDKFISESINIPDSTAQLSVKPYHIFLRYLLKSLVSGTFPADVTALVRRLKQNLNENRHSKDENAELAYLTHSLSAYALYLALFRAGTADSKVFDQLKAIYAIVHKRSRDVARHMPFTDRLRHKNLAFLTDMLLVSMALVNSGTSHKESFGLLRSSFMSLLDECPTRAYFHHLALGFLLVGRGRYAVGTNQGLDAVAVASIVMSVVSGLNFPFMEDEHHASRHMQWLWIGAIAEQSVSFTDGSTLHLADPEDVFLSEGAGSRSEYYRLLAFKGKSFASLHRHEMEFLKRFYGNQASENHLFDMLALQQSQV